MLTLDPFSGTLTIFDAHIGMVHENLLQRYIFGTTPTLWLVNAAIVVAFLMFVVWPLIVVPFIDLLDFRRLSRAKKVFLELIPPSSISKTARANDELFAVLHGLYAITTFKHFIFQQKQAITFEMVSTRNEGIRYIACVPGEKASAFRQNVASYLPGIQFKKVDDYLSATDFSKSGSFLSEFKLSRHFAYPLKTHDTLGQHDPVAFIAGAMIKPDPGEALVFQLILNPVNPKAAAKVRNKLVVGRQPTLHGLSWQMPFHLLVKLVGIALSIVATILETFDAPMQTVSHPMPRQERAKPEALQKLDDDMLAKLSHPLFRSEIRAFIRSNDQSKLKERTLGVYSALSSFDNPGVQSLIMKRRLLLSRFRKYREFQLYKFAHRLPAIFSSNACLLSSEEVANIYHFPYGQGRVAENLAQSHSRTLSAPAVQKQRADESELDVLIGTNLHHGTSTPIGLSAGERERHMYVIGGTGNGKTTMLQYEIIQDIRNGKGVAVVDPHGDLAETLLRYIPDDRIKDVIYFNPVDIAHPIGLNLLEQPEGLSEDELLLEQDFITESVVSIFRKIFSEDNSGGHRIEHFLRNAIHTAFTVPDATLFTVYKLLTNAKFRRSVTKNLTDEDLIDFWKGEFNSAGDYQKVKMSSGVTAKLGRFQRSVVTKRILEQHKSTIDFDDIIQNNKILICNFSKGQIGEDTSALLGISVLSKLQLAALRRSRMGQARRTSFYLYVDEFQNFATMSFVQMLSEARKYKLFLTMAEQSTAQQSDRMLTEAILANVGTVVCFRTGSTFDEALLLPIFHPFIEKGEIMNLPAYSYYVRIAAVQPQEPMSGTTVLAEGQGSDLVANQVIEHSREAYARAIKIELTKEVTAASAKKYKTKRYITSHTDDFDLAKAVE